MTNTQDSKAGSAGAMTTSTAKQEDWTVEKVVSTLPKIPEPNSSSPVPFFHLLERLKTTKREGWRRFGINHGESISDHMYRMALITMVAPPSLRAKLDVGRCTRMALVHDMAEALVGDITPMDGVAKPEKNRREASTMDYMTTTLLGNVYGGAAGDELRALWQEYEDSCTLESKYVHDIDKLELVLQMVEYERANKGRLDLSEFSNVANRIELEEVHGWCHEVLKEREEYWRDLGKETTGAELTEQIKAQQDAYYGNGSATGPWPSK